MVPDPADASLRSVMSPAVTSAPSVTMAAGMRSKSPAISVRAGADRCVSPENSGKSTPSSGTIVTGNPVLASPATIPEALSVNSNVVVGVVASKSSTTVAVSRSPGATSGPGSATRIVFPLAGVASSEAISTRFHSTCMRST